MYVWERRIESRGTATHQVVQNVPRTYLLLAIYSESPMLANPPSSPFTRTAPRSLPCLTLHDAGGIALAVIISALALTALVALVLYMVSEEEAFSGENEERLFVGVMRRIPFQSIKIVIVSWQILTQVRDGGKNKMLRTLDVTRGRS